MSARQTIFAAVCCLLSAPLFAAEQDRGGERGEVDSGYLYGIGLGLSQQLYKGYDWKVTPFPILGYIGEKLKVLGPFISYELVQLNDIEITVRAAPNFSGYEESDSDIFEGMDDRKASMDLGFGLNVEQNDWKFGASAMHDVLDRSDGFELTADIGKVFKKRRYLIEPTLGISYLDRDFVDYYYGVKRDEATEFRPAFDGTSSLNLNAGISISTPIFFGGMSRLGIENTWYDSSVTDSPLTDEDSSFSILFTFTRFF